MTNTLLGLIGLTMLCVFFIGVGVLALGWPEKLQECALNYYSHAQGLAKRNPFIKWMQTSAYVLSLRITGALAVLVGLLGLVVLAKSI